MAEPMTDRQLVIAVLMEGVKFLFSLVVLVLLGGVFCVVIGHLGRVILADAVILAGVTALVMKFIAGRGEQK